MKRIQPLFFAFMALVVTLACSTISNLGATPTPLPTFTPQPTFTASPEPTRVSNALFEDGEFSNSCITGNTDDVDRFVDNGQFKMLVRPPSIVAWTDCTTEEFSDFIYEADATQLDGPDNNIYGVIFRYDPGLREFYTFAISGDGYYVLAVDGPDRSEPEMLIEWTSSSAINLGSNVTNRLKVEAFGSNISIYVNDVFLADYQDSRLSSGVVGFFVGSIDEGNVLIGFDNMKVSAP